ncbi:cytochrome P450 71D9-like [Tripterygium wilfordii]|uniref:cytochrome P450 71D9-like n=1 Tax=Tripterygium wilfordii TaxID=458696 RepID=UPI0018F85F37|nr:cytochrome P450 71D9-like [Tripterygium wilfordii]XP_038685223.1 cytochrome P450 71D9-like [Tripterygium wilfordii]
MDYQFPSFPVLLGFLVFIFMLLRIWRKSRDKKSNSVSPPGPWKLPLIGNMHQMIGSLPHRRLRDLATKYGPIMHLQLGEVSTVIFSSPEVAKEVLKTNDIKFATRPYSLAADIISYNIKNIGFAPYGEYWRQMRKICTMEIFSDRRVQAARPIREEEVLEFIKSISLKVRSKINLSEMLTGLTFAITMKAAFGGVSERHEAFVPLIREIMEVAGGFSLADMFPSIKFFHTISGMRTRLERLHREIDKIFESLINEHKFNRSRIDSSDANNFLDILLNLQEHGDFSFTIDNIKAVVLDIFIAGTDTSAITLEWAMSELLKNPRVIAKAQTEVREVFDKKGYVDEAGLEELEFLRAVIKETLRLHPPGPLLAPRECRERCQINGYEIPEKTHIIINAWAIGRDPNYWIEAERFYPERFLDSSIDYKGNNFEYLPFGAGRRMCPGISFGIANIELPLAQLLYHFDWKLPDNIKQEDLDMTECFGIVVTRKSDLVLIPIPYNSPVVEENK